MGNKEKTPRNVTEVVNSQKSSCILPYYKECILCLHEKLEIVDYPQPEELLNKRSELVSKRRHASKILLNNYKSND